MAVWKLILHHEEEYRSTMLHWSQRHGRVALGWGETGPLSSFRSWQEIRQAIKSVEAYERDLHPMNWLDGARSLWSLTHEVRTGDLVIQVSQGSAREGVMEVLDNEILWEPEMDLSSFRDYQHQRRARVRNNISPEYLWAKVNRRALPGYSVRWALCKCSE